MAIYERGDGERPVVDAWGGGFSWVAHPHETGKRASHAVRSSDGEGVWLLDPCWAAGITDRIDDLGPVAGVAVCFDWHARDADRFARHYDVPVTVPAWVDRVDDLLETPIDRVAASVGDSGFEPLCCAPLPGWREAILVREADGTIYVPESLGTAGAYTVGDERLGTGVVRRLDPPRDLLWNREPDRVLVGHGGPITDDATRALEDALAGSRRRFPRAVRENGPTQLRSLIAALRG